MVVSVEITVDQVAYKVRKMTGTEEWSRCFHYNALVEMSALDASCFDPLGKPATITFLEDGIPGRTVLAKVAGSVQITEAQSNADATRFRLQLVPELWFTGLTEKTNIFPKMSMLDVLKERLETARIPFRMDEGLEGPLYEERPLISQYRESTLNFVSRLMEDRGLYYYFDHEADGELVISDTTLDYGQEIPFDVNRQMIPGTWTRVTNMAPTKVWLTGYDFSRPSTEIRGEAGEGDEFEIHIDDEPVLHQEEADALAQVRLEQLQNQSSFVTFKSFNPELSPGSTFTNRSEYVVTQVHHNYVHEDAGKHDEANQYTNTVTAIDAEKLFRPERKTPLPRVKGTEIAQIHAGLLSTEYAKVDGDGLYTVKLNYVSEKDNAPALTELRMQQPAAGAHDGFYFPLKDGVEVVIAFNKGNPDLPYIHGAMSNGEYPAPVKAPTNPHHSVIKAQHLLMMQARGGVYTKYTAYDFEEAEHQFKELAGFGAEGDSGVPVTGDEMSASDEESGRFHVQRRYGDKYTYLQGHDFVYGHEDNKVFSFGRRYIEHHANKASAEDEIYPLADETGLVEKTFGNKNQYHCGTAKIWAESELNSGKALPTYHYGSRYTEYQFNIGGGDVGGPNWSGESGFVEKTKGNVFIYRDGNLTQETKGENTISHEGDVEETIDGDVTRTYKKKVTETYEGMVEEQYQQPVTINYAMPVTSNFQNMVEKKFFAPRSASFFADALTFEHSSGVKVTAGIASETFFGLKNSNFLGASLSAQKNYEYEVKEGKIQKKKDEISDLKTRIDNLKTEIKVSNIVTFNVKMLVLC